MILQSLALINEETRHCAEARWLIWWHGDRTTISPKGNNAKDMILNPQKRKEHHIPVHIDETEVERVKISPDLTTQHI